MDPWGWDLHPSVLLGTAALAALYIAWGGLRGVRRRVAAFFASLVVLLLALNGPMHNLSDRYLFCAHMVQHLVLTMLFPPLLLYGVPADMMRRLLRPRWLLRASRALTRPVPAAVVFVAPMALWHLPVFYEAALRHHPLHVVQHLVFLSTAVIVWWPILSPLPELPRAPYPVQMLYLFLLGIPLSIVGALITLAGRVLYPFYAEAPRVFPGFDALMDQQVGGLIMWVVGGLIFWVVMTVVWFRWSVRDEAGDAEREVPLEAYR
jgi:putative membrane protein